MGGRLQGGRPRHAVGQGRSQHETGNRSRRCDTPVGEMKVDQDNGRQAGDPDGIAVVHHVHPAEKQRQLDETDHVEEILGPRQRRLAGKPVQHQQAAHHADGAAYPEILVGLRQPCAPDPVEQRMPDQREGAKVLQTQDRRMEDGFQRGVQHLFTQLAGSRVVQQPFPERLGVHGRNRKVGEQCIGRFRREFDVIVTALPPRAHAPPC